MTKHTPGPWSASKHGTPDYAPQYGVYAGDSARDHVIVMGPNAQADAALIAAAPEMLAALAELVAEADEHPGWEGHARPDTAGFQLARDVLRTLGC